jgi:ABC-type iron transport system FetAB permease component
MITNKVRKVIAEHLDLDVSQISDDLVIVLNQSFVMELSSLISVSNIVIGCGIVTVQQLVKQLERVLDKALPHQQYPGGKW